jgi:hypothetical protein
VGWYLARYTYRVAIRNDRLRSFDGQRVRFGYRDRDTGEPREAELAAVDFLSRFSGTIELTVRAAGSGDCSSSDVYRFSCTSCRGAW